MPASDSLAYRPHESNLDNIRLQESIEGTFSITAFPGLLLPLNQAELVDVDCSALSRGPPYRPQGS